MQKGIVKDTLKENFIIQKREIEIFDLLLLLFFIFCYMLYINKKFKKL